MRAFALIWWLLAPNAFGYKVTDCFTGFATLSYADKDQLTALTYGQLLAEIGGVKLSPEVLGQMIEGKDPFGVPQKGKEDLGSLRKRLREFEALLDQKEWNTPETRALLLRELLKRKSGQAEAAVRVQNHVAMAVQDFERHVEPGPHPIVFSPDGEWAVFRKDPAFSLGGEKPEWLVVLDVATGKTHKQKLSGEMQSEPRFSPDGSALLFSNPWKGFHVIPFTNGKAELTQAVEPFALDSSRREWVTVEPLPTTNPQRFFHRTYLGGLSLFDLATKQRTDVKWNEYAPDSEPLITGIVPGTDHPWRLTLEKGKFHLHIVSVDQEGKVTAIDASHAFESRPFRVGFSGNGAPFLMNEEGIISVTAGPGKPFVPLTPQRDRRYFRTFPKAVAHPTQKNLVLVFVRGEDNTTSVETFNLKTGESVLVEKIKDTLYDNPIFTADGTKLMWKTKAGNAHFANPARFLP